MINGTTNLPMVVVVRRAESSDELESLRTRASVRDAGVGCLFDKTVR
jgi:hypothetical protein